MVLLIAIKGASLISTERGHLIYLNDALKDAARFALENSDHALPYQIKIALEGLEGKNRNGRAFNPGISASFGPGYFFSVRVMFHHLQGYKEIVPGNILEQGKNFWWRDFYSPEINGTTVFFHADPTLKDFSVAIPENYNDFEMWSRAMDTRVVRRKNDIVVFNAGRPIIASKISSLRQSIEGINYFNFEDALENIKPGHNYGLIDTNFVGKIYSYVDWYFLDGVRFAKVNNKTINYSYLTYDKNYPLLGTGSTQQDGNNAARNSGLMPLFSVGSSHLPLDNQNYLGVGHIKIPVDDIKFTYENDSTISKFRANLVRDLKQAFGDRYIRHNSFHSGYNISSSYHYLLYFYIFKLDAKKNPIEMRISDAFLPIDVQHARDKDNYVFSLVFPMGITPNQNNPDSLLISAGFGDYYAAIIDLPKQEILDWCRHDVKNIDMRNYNYNFMRFDGKGNFDIVPRYTAP